MRMRRGAGQLIGMALLAIIIIYAMLFLYARLYIALREEVRQITEFEIPAHEEKLLVLPPRNGSVLVIGQWKGWSTIIGIVCDYGGRNASAIPLWELGQNLVDVPPWMARNLTIPTWCRPTICIVTAYYNVFCNITIPKGLNKTIVFEPMKPWFRFEPSDVIEVSLNMSSWTTYEYDGYRLNKYSGYSIHGGVPVIVAEGIVDVAYGIVNTSVVIDGWIYFGGIKSCTYVNVWICSLEVEIGDFRVRIRNGSAWITIDRPLILVPVVTDPSDPSEYDLQPVEEGSRIYVHAVDGTDPSGSTPPYRTFVVVEGLRIDLSFTSVGWRHLVVGVSKPLVAFAIGSNASTGILCFDASCSKFASYRYAPNVSRALLALMGFENVPPPTTRFGHSVSIAVLELRNMTYVGTVDFKLYDLGNGSEARVLVVSYGRATKLDSDRLVIGAIRVPPSESETPSETPSFDAYSARAIPVLLVAEDNEARVAYAIVIPRQISFESVRRVAGYAEPGTLSIVVDHSNDAYDGSYELTVNYSKIFDLDLNLPIDSSQGATTTIVLSAWERIWITLLNTSLTIRTIHNHTVKIEEQPPSPPPTPPPPPQPPKEPKIAPKVWIEYSPKPNSSQPIAMTVKIYVQEPNIDPSRYSVVYLLDDAYGHHIEDGVLTFKKIDSNTIVATYEIPGDRGYFLCIEIDENGDPLMFAFIKNFKERFD